MVPVKAVETRMAPATPSKSAPREEEPMVAVVLRDLESVA